jgi:hypothetical protein
MEQDRQQAQAAEDVNQAYKDLMDIIPTPDRQSLDFNRPQRWTVGEYQRQIERCISEQRIFPIIELNMRQSAAGERRHREAPQRGSEEQRRPVEARAAQQTQTLQQQRERDGVVSVVISCAVNRMPVSLLHCIRDTGSILLSEPGRSESFTMFQLGSTMTLDRDLARSWSIRVQGGNNQAAMMTIRIRDARGQEQFFQAAAFQPVLIQP